MDIGTGIAIAGVWMFAGMMGISRNVSNFGLLLALGIASIVTLVILTVVV